MSLSANVTPYNASLVSAGRTGASLTSTAAPISTKTENALWDEEDLMFEAVQAKGEKGYARLVRILDLLPTSSADRLFCR